MTLTEEEKQQKYAELAAYIDEHKNEKGPLMPIMQKAQELFTYLSLETQVFIADRVGVPVTDVYGVACYVKGSQDVLNEVKKILGIEAGETTDDGKFTIQDTRCLGCCGLAPVMTINDKVYGRLVPADVKGILASY